LDELNPIPALSPERGRDEFPISPYERGQGVRCPRTNRFDIKKAIESIC